MESKYKEKVDHLAIELSARLWWAEAGTYVYSSHCWIAGMCTEQPR